MPTKCVSVIKALVVRLTLLDACGVPVTGAGSAQVVTAGFTKVENTPNYEDGERYLQKRADGSACINEQSAGFLNWLEQAVTLCTLDPDLIALITGDPLITTGVTNNTGVIHGGGLLNTRFSMETWQPVAGAGACAADGSQQYVYWAFPHAFDTRLQGFNMENAPFTIAWQHKTKPASNDWNIGDAYLGDNPADTWGTDRHWAWNITTVAPPVEACGAVELANAS